MTLDYEYDLVSMKVNLVSYQKGQQDQFFHQYEYDADNRITKVLTSKDGTVWNRDAKYFYYDHGPLARTEIGHDKVQGIDNAYTMHGWIKGVNSNTLDATRDQGNDGNLAVSLSGVEGLNKNIAKDAFGYSLNYYEGDYKPIGTIADIDNFIASAASLNSAFLNDAPGLFNGNISGMVTAITDADPASADFGQAKPQHTAYRYDQLNRIKQMKAYRDINLATNTWNVSNDNSYQENFTYDGNGNILTLERNGRLKTTAPASPLAMDKLEYKYENIATGYNRNTNKLRWLNDEVAAGNYKDDIDDQDTDNYNYDEIGNLISDAQDTTASIEWNVAGRITKVIRGSGCKKPDLEFSYDAMGNRVAKTVKPAATKTDEETWTTTFYVRDATGNVMATYEKKKEASQQELFLTEQMVYGSSRIGLVAQNLNLTNPITLSQNQSSTRLGMKMYEGKNHLGNVLVVFSDRKIPVASGTSIVSFNTDVVTNSDYYAFGMTMPGRNYVGSEQYRYGFNGKENDAELNSIHFELREYDARLGRMFSRDPRASEYPWQTPYAYHGNNPINIVDYLGGGDPPKESKIGKFFRKNLPGIIAAPVAGVVDMLGGAGSFIGSFFKGDKTMDKEDRSQLRREARSGSARDMLGGFLSTFGLKEALFEKWTSGTTGGKMPTSLVALMESVQTTVSIDHPDAGLNGMHAWHAGTNAVLSNKLGPIGALVVFLGGLFHESPFDRGSFGAEQTYQGTINHILDSGSDIIANVFGISMGLLLPKTWAEKISIKLGNQIPGPGDADPAFGGGHGSYYNWDLWIDTGERRRTGVKSSDYWFEQPKW
jgi:RHS repeat-associated protein